MTFKNLLLLDIRIKDLNEIINSIHTETTYILIDYYNDTFESILDKINILNISTLISVGLVRHGYYLSTYKFIDKQSINSIIQNVEIDDPNIESWKEITYFLIKLKEKYNIQFFDFISCRLDKYPEYKYVFTKLENTINIKIGASVDDIGNLGGNWILEDGNINLLDTYFNENILKYPYLFFTPVITIKPNSVTKYYDGIYFINPTVTYVGFIDNDTYQSLSGSIIYDGTYISALNTGTYAITCNGLTSDKYYLDYQIGNLFILPATLNISINNYIKIYNGLNDMDDYIVNYSGFISNENNSNLSGSLILSGTFLTAVNVGIYTIIPSGYYSANYNIVYESSILTIKPASLLIIANNVSKIYNQNAYYGGDGVIYDGFMDDDTSLDLQGTLTFIGDSQGAYNIGTYTIMPSGLTSINYSIIFISGTLTIYTDSFLIKANDFAKFYDNLFFSNPTISYTGDINDLSGTIIYSGSYQYGLNIGTYTIYSNGLYSTNYDLTFYDGTLKIDKNEVYIIANDIIKIYDAIPYSDIVVTIEGLKENDTSNIFQGSLLNLGSSYGIVNIGIYNIIPFNLYSDNYSILYKQGTLIINPAPLYINAHSFTKMYDGTSDIDNDIMQSNIIYSISGIINNEIITLISYTVRYKNHIAGQHFIDISNITLSGFTLTNYYIVSPPPIPGIILHRPVKAKFTGGNKTYDGTTSVYGLLYSLSGILGLEEVSISSYLAVYRSERAGQQIIDISFVTLYGITSPNYYVSTIFPFMGLIYQNFLQINFYGGNKSYDSYTVPGPLTYTIEGVSEGDVITISSYIAIFRTPYAGRQIIDISYIILDGPMAYTYTPPKMISIYAYISPIYLTLKYSGGNKHYDATNGVPTLLCSISGMVAFDIITISSCVARYRNTNVGYHYLDISYTILYGPAGYIYYPVEPIKATISKRGVYAKFFSTGKLYDGTRFVDNIVGITVSGTVEREYIYKTSLSGQLMKPYYPVIELGNFDISSYRINLTDYSNNIWYIYTNGITSNLYFDASGIIRAHPQNLFNYKVFDKLGPNSIYYQKDLSLNIIKYKYPYLDISANIIDPTAKWIWSDVSYNIQQYQAIYYNNTDDFQYGTIYSNINANVDIYMNGYFLGNTNNVYTTFKYPILIYPGTNTFIFVSTIINNNPGLLISIIDNITNKIIINSNKLNWSFCINRPIIKYNYYSYSTYMENLYINYFKSIFRTPDAILNLIDISDVLIIGEILEQNVLNNYYLLPVEPINAPIYKRKLTIKFFNGYKKYDGTIFTPQLTFSLSGMINESVNDKFLDYYQSLTISSYFALFRSPNVGLNIIDISNVILSGFYANNYFINPIESINAYIDYALLIASFKGGNKRYDTTRFTGPLTFSLSGMINNDQITISSFIALFQSKAAGNRFIDISNVILYGYNINNYKLYNIPPFQSYIEYKNVYASFSGGSKIYDSLLETGSIYGTLSDVLYNDDVNINYFISKFRNNTIGSNIIDISYIILRGLDVNNYNLISINSFNSYIYPRQINILFYGGSKIYDSNRNAGLMNYVINNVVSNEVITISSFIAYFRDPNVGLNTIDISNVILDGITVFNYELLNVKSISGIIYKKLIKANFNGGNKIYDGTRLTGLINYSLSGIVNNEIITISSFISLFQSKTAGNRFIDVSNVILYGYNINNYILDIIPSFASYIEYKNVYASFSGGSKIYDSLLETGSIDGTLSGLIYNDDVNINYFISKFRNNTIGSNIIDISYIILRGLDVNNYNLISINSFNSYILPRQISIIFYGGSKIYDSYRNAGLMTYVINNVVSNEVITISSLIAYFRNPNAGLNTIDISNVILDGQTAFNYEILNIKSISGIIYKKGLICNFIGGNKIYDKTYATSLLIYSISGIISDENIFIDSFTSQYQDNRAGDRLIDISNVILKGDKPNNYYVINIKPIIGTIYKKIANANFDNINKEYDGTIISNFRLNGYLTNIINNDDVFIDYNNYIAKFKSPNAGLNTLDISNIIILGKDAINYYVSSGLTISGYIYPKSLIINFSNGEKIYDGTQNINQSLSYSFIGSIQTDNLKIISYTALFKNQNIGFQFIDISNVILSGIQTNYNINPINPINSYIYVKNINVIFSGGDKIYDKTLIPGTIIYSISGIVNNENIILSSYTSLFNNYNTGLRRIDISNVILSGPTINNYNLQTINPINANIYKRPGLVYFTGGDKVYDGNTIPSTIYINVTSKLPSDDININYLIAYFINKNVGNTIINIDDIVIGGIDVNNYDYTIITTISSYIYPKNISILFSNINKFYDKTLNINSISGNLIGLISNDDVFISNINGKYRNFNAGVQIIDISNIILGGLDSQNYKINPILPFNSTIYPSQLNALFTISDKLYDNTNIPQGINYQLYHVYNNDNVFLSSYNAFYINKNSGYRRIDISNAILGGLDSNNYKLNNIPSTYSNIISNELTVIFFGGDKVYDKTTNVPSLNYTITGITNNENIVLNYYIAKYRNINCGVQIIDISDVILRGPTINNYIINPILPINGNILQKPLIPIFTNLSKIYDGTNLIVNTISARLNGILINDQVYIESFIGLYNNNLVGNVIIDISQIIINGLSSNNYYVLPSYGLTTQILKRLLVITFSGGDKIYDGLLETGLIYNQISNLVLNDLITISSLISKYRNPNSGYQIIDISNIILNGSSINNYFINPIMSITGYIYPKPINISFTGINKIYDNTINAYVNNPILSGLIDNITISSYYAYYLNKFVENNKTIFITNILLNSNNYTPPSTITTFSNITPKQIYLISDGVNREYDQTNNALLINMYLSGIFEDDKLYVSISSYIAKYNDINAQNNKQINISNIILNNIYSNNYYIDTASTIGTIYKKIIPVYFQINNKNYDGLTNASVYNISISNVIHPDFIFVNSYKSNFIDANVGFNKLVIVSDISFDGLSKNNYIANNFYGSSTITYPLYISIRLTTNTILYKDISNYMTININPLWKNISYNINNNLVGIYKNIIITNNGLIYDNSNNIFISNFTFTNLSMTDDNNGFICGISGLILVTTNSFKNTNILNYGINTFNSISKINSFISFIVGNNGSIYKTSNSGLTWNQITSGTINNLNDVSLVDNNIVYIIGSNGIILKSIDGGLSWITKIISSDNLNSIVMIDQYNGFIVGNNGLILKTNNGNNWTEILRITSNHLKHIYASTIDDIIIVGNNGTILRSINRGLTWITYMSGTLINLNRIYAYSKNNIIVIGDNGIILSFILNPSGYIDINDSNILLTRINISENNPLYYYYLNSLLVKNYNLNVTFTANDLNNYGIGYSNNLSLNVKPIIFYQNNTIDTVYERNNIIYSDIPFTDQSGGIFSILDNIQENKVNINAMNGIITFQTNINVNYYLFTIIYTINNSSNQTTFTLIIRPTFYYSINFTSLIINNSGLSVIPYFNQKNGTFKINDISGNLVKNNLVTINSLSGIIIFSNNIPINTYSFNVLYTLNSISRNSIYYLNIIPFINYTPNILNLKYNTSNITNTPNVNNSGGVFTIDNINKISINNLGAISISSGVDVGLYNLNIIYTFNGMSNNTIYTINAAPFIQYPETYRLLSFEHTIYDGSSNPIYYPLGGLFYAIDISGLLINQNLVTINSINGQLIFNNIDVNTYKFNIYYLFNNAYEIIPYTLQIKQVFYYNINKTIMYINESSNSILPYVNPNIGTFSITGNNNLLVQLNLVRINFFTGLISFLSNIEPGLYNFTVNYTINNIRSTTNYILEVLPILNYSINTRTLLYDSSGFSVNPIYNPIGGVFSLSGIINNLISINNNGLLFFNKLINVGKYDFNVIYLIKNVFTFNPYQLIISPIINYNINSLTLQYQRLTESYSIRPYINQSNGIFTINDFSNNQSKLTPNFISIDQSGIIIFSKRIDTGIYNLIINYTLNNITNFTTYNLTIKPEFYYPLGNINLLYDRSIIINTEEPFIDQSGGIFNMTSNLGTINDKTGIISLNNLININRYILTLTYTLRKSFNTTTYIINIIPNIYYTISSIIVNYSTSSKSNSPYYSPLGGLFNITDLSNSNLVINNLVTITQVGILSFNKNINVGVYNIKVTYNINNITNETIFTYNVIPNLTYIIPSLTLLIDQSGNSINPIFSQPNGIFIIKDISNDLILINPINGIINFKAGINVGIYDLNIIYTLNNISNNFIYQLNILPKLNYNDNNKNILYERNVIINTDIPYYYQQGGIFTIIDNLGSLVNNNQVTINAINGIISFNTNINVGSYYFNIIYNLNGLSNSTIFNLNVIPNLEYTPNNTTLNYNNNGTSNTPYYNQLNGSFNIIDVLGNLVQSNIVIINPSTGVINFPKAINVGLYSFNVIYLLNGVSNTIMYYLTIIPNITYSIGFKNLNYGVNSTSELPIVNQTKGIFNLSDLSGNAFAQNSTFINNITGLITFTNYINVGVYILNVQYTLNNASNYYKYYLTIYPTITYIPNSQSLLYNRTTISTSSKPIINQSNGNFTLLNTSNIVYMDSSGIIYFTNNILVGNYTFNILYSLNGLSVTTSYNLLIIPNIEYLTTINTLLYNDDFNSGIPYYDQSGGIFSFNDISGNLILENIIKYDISNGLYFFNKYPNVGLYNLQVIYTYNLISNYQNIIFYILPIVYYNINDSKYIYNSNNYSMMPFTNQTNGKFSIVENINGIFIDTSNGIINFSNNINVNSYILTITYYLNLVSNTTKYYLTIYPICDYYYPFLVGPYNSISQSETAIYEPLGGTFMVTSQITDISLSILTNEYINNGYITIDLNNGVLIFDTQINVNIYKLLVTYTYNNISNNVNFSFTKQPLIYYNPSYQIIKYRDISFSTIPLIAPFGGIFNASVPFIDLIYTGLSINRNTGVIRFGAVNAGFWEITVNYIVNNIVKSIIYKLEVQAGVFYTPPYSVISYNTIAFTTPPTTEIKNGQFSSPSTIPRFSIDIVSGALTFNRIVTGVYYIPIIYTIYGIDIVINYTLVVKPTFIYNPNFITTYYTNPVNSVVPIANPPNGIFGATFNDDNLSPLINTITIDTLSGIIYTSPLLRVGIYNISVNYTVNNSVELKPYIINVYPIFNYPIGFSTIIYGNVSFTEQPYTNPRLGFFSTTSKFYIDVSSGIILFSPSVSVGQYVIPINYTYNGLSVTQNYNLTVNPIYYYYKNYIEVIINNGGQSGLPYAKQELGIFSYISVSGTLGIPYNISYLSSGDQYINNGIILNGYTGILNFGDKILVGSYSLILGYTIFNLTATTKFTFIVKPYISYGLSNLILDYNTNAVSSIPIVDQSGGFFYFSNMDDLNTEFNKITINNKTGVINFYNGIKVGKFKINITYIVNQISNSIIYNLTIRPIFYYSNPNTTIIYGELSNSNNPTTIQSGGIFEIIDYNGLTNDNIYIDTITGIIYYMIIPISSYIFTIKYTLNNSSVTTNYNLTVLPKILYDIDNTTLFYSKSSYSILPYVLFPGGLFSFSDITSLDFLYTKAFIDASNGQLYFAKYINTGFYNIEISYLYNNIYNYTTYKLTILPLIEYDISGISLDYNHNIYNTIEPIINPTKGLFFFADFSNNYPINGLTINKTTGSITIKKLNVGNYFVGIKYYLKEFCSANRFIISILPSFYYLPTFNITYSNIDITYSDIPFTDPSGGLFNFVYPLYNNLLNKININNKTGQILFYNSIDVSAYTFYISYTYNNTSFAKFNLIVKPYFIYNESSLIILNKNSGSSSIPLTYPNNGIFIIDSINLQSNGITINSNTGIIYINNNVNIGKYILNIIYMIDTLLYSNFIYTIEILPNLLYPISQKNISYGYLEFSESPLIDSQNGFFYIDSIYNNNGIFIDQSSGILRFNPIIYVNYYPITINYSLYNIKQETTYKLIVMPDLYYDISNIIINHNEIYKTNTPFINPTNGIFKSNYGLIDLSGVINLSNLSVSSYVINVTYLYNYISNIYKINLLIKPYLYYNNFQYNIYGLTFYSNYPMISPNNGIFYIDTSNIIIDSNGLITFNQLENIGKYNFNVYYTVNNISNIINYQYYIIPYIDYLNPIYEFRGGINNKTDIPITNPINGKFNINYYYGITIDNSGSLIINSNTVIGTYNINVNYSFGDLSNNFMYNLSVMPYIYYDNKVINYQTKNSSEIPYKNSINGSFSIEFYINSEIIVNSILIDISSGIIYFDSSLDIGSYFFYVIYTVNLLKYTHTYYLNVIPNIAYDNINVNHLTSYSLLPTIINPTGGLFYSNNLPYFITLDLNNGLIYVDENNKIGQYKFIISYTINNLSNNYEIIVNVNPNVYYKENYIITYNDIGYSFEPYTSISGGLYMSYNLPNGLVLNYQNGIFNYSNNLMVKEYLIKVFYYINDVSGITIFNLVVKPFFNYTTGLTIVYGQNGSSILPDTNPTGGIFSLKNSYSNISINSVYGIITFNSNINVGSYEIPIIYTYNDVSSNYIYNLSITQKIIYAHFTVNDKIYDGTNSIIFNDNKLIGVINNDRVFINSYNGVFQTTGPGYDVPILIYNLSLGGLDVSNYILQYDNLSTGNIYIVKYNPDYYKMNFGKKGSSNLPIVSSLLTNPLFILSSISSNIKDISNILTNNFDIDPYGIINWNDSLPLGIYNIIVKAYNNILNYNVNYTLVITKNLYEGEIYVNPPELPTTNIKSDVYQEEYNSITGNAYILSNKVDGLLGKFLMTAYDANNNINHDLGDLYPFKFKLENADPSAILFTYELNDDGSINYSEPYQLIYVGNYFWTTSLRFLSDYYVQDTSVLTNELPMFNPPSDIYYVDSLLEVSIEALPNSLIFYTLDGSDPTINSLIYSGPIKLSSTVIIKAFASTPNYANSQISVGTYIINIVVCILSKTYIRTPMGDQYIDNLRDGDLIITSDNRIVPIIKIIKYYIEDSNEYSYPVCIPKDYFGIDMPNNNTYLSQNHAINLLNNKWIYGRDHLKYFTLYKTKPLYFHVLLPNYYTDDLIANNIIVESWSGFTIKNSNVKYIYDGNTTHNNKEYKTFKKIIKKN